MLELKKEVWIYNFKRYSILYETKVKFPKWKFWIFQGKMIWVDAIVYYCLYENSDGQIWVRTKKDFLNNFKLEE